MPSARPGHVAPHAPLRDGRSIIDLFGHGFVLLCFDEGSVDACLAQMSGMQEAARAMGIPLSLKVLAEPEAHALYGRRYVLVRPDGHVAWRDDTLPAQVAELFARVTGHRPS